MVRFVLLIKTMDTISLNQTNCLPIDSTIVFVFVLVLFCIPILYCYLGSFSFNFFIESGFLNKNIYIF